MDCYQPLPAGLPVNLSRLDASVIVELQMFLGIVDTRVQQKRHFVTKGLQGAGAIALYRQ
jgi:hypothetical protein